MAIEHKILFTGTMGAGKTSAIAAISEVIPMRTEARNTDLSVGKATTTVGLDYGEVTLENGEKLRLYGTPGQKRFEFMWSILARGALGLIILIDNSRPDPLADLDIYLENFARLIAETGCVVAVGRTETHPAPGLDAFAQRMEARGVICPVVPANATRAEDVLQLIHLLLLQLESRTGHEALR
ncbi:ATP/GTP-binding protein [Xenophilus sp. Marseille-Q4582]|uniref:GTP-binding protein n=1 Tax=Xenophilus sp. Marseille-Q4582 TaxID=2866600 RepID=UPI001CE3CFE6|nr:ATP/GTP-binding protein [Xenophilus sp. Marseille-Q4582]